MVDLHISLSSTIMKVPHVKTLVADCDKADLTHITLQIRCYETLIFVVKCFEEGLYIIDKEMWMAGTNWMPKGDQP